MWSWCSGVKQIGGLAMVERTRIPPRAGLCDSLLSRSGGTRPEGQVRARFAFRVRWIRLKTPTAAGFIRAASPDHDQFVAFHQSLGVHGRISAANADG